MHRCGMLEAPVSPDPARSPWLQVELLRRSDMLLRQEHIEVLASQYAPIAFEIRSAHLLRKRCEVSPVLRRQVRVISRQRFHKCEFPRQVSQLNREVAIKPVLLHPSVPDASRIRGSQE